MTEVIDTTRTLPEHAEEQVVERDLQTVEMELNMGPQHPSTHGVLRVILHLDGERIVRAQFDIGYLHRGKEKLCEYLDYRQGLSQIERTDYLAPWNDDLAFVMAAEKLAGIEVPERALYVRTIMCELNRIASHLVFYGAFGIDAGAITPFMYGFRVREVILNFFEYVSGGRFFPQYFRVGGLKEDVPDGFVERCRQTLDYIKQGIDDCDRLLSSNEIFLSRTKGVGVLSAEDAIALGVSGPMLRASGVPIDIRRTEPYMIYDRFEFDIPVGTNGDSYDRYILRIEEMRQSVRIIEQALKDFPGGPIMARMPKAFRPPAGEVYLRTEAPRGEYGIHLVSRGGSDKPYRVKIRAPSFSNLAAMEHVLPGAFLADAPIIIGSIDIVLGDVDR
jgi:NADH-quinone oxidoreductase subunit D